MHPGKVESWPNQQKPPSNAWVMWHTVLKAAFLYRGQKLKTPLGLWMSWQSDWIWNFYYPTSRVLNSFSLKTWKIHTIIKGRHFRPVFESVGTVAPKPDYLQRATVTPQDRLTAHNPDRFL
jgi:hypothetical protein